MFRNLRKQKYTLPELSSDIPSFFKDWGVIINLSDLVINDNPEITVTLSHWIASIYQENPLTL